MLRLVSEYNQYNVHFNKGHEQSFQTKATLALITYLESKLGAKFTIDCKNFLMSRVDLVGPSRLFKQLFDAEIVEWMTRTTKLPDSPFFFMWSCKVMREGRDEYTGGASVHGEENALYATLAEALERFLWYSQSDYFDSPLTETEHFIKENYEYLSPECFVGYSDDQRLSLQRKILANKEENRYLWIKGKSLLDKKDYYLPAQIVSGAVKTRILNEPQIRDQVTGGLATWTSAKGAQLAGLLELIERDAYFITWLNQLAPLRVNLESVSDLLSPQLKKLLQDCARYRMKVSVIQMVTDAPTFAIMVVLEDCSRSVPHYHIGLNAHYDFSKVVEGALLEALRAVQNYQQFFLSGKNWDPKTPVEKIDHQGRSLYWGEPDNASGLKFLIEGPLVDLDRSVPWFSDDDDTHMVRLLDWCRINNYACVSVPLTKSKKNTTNLHVEVVVVPDLYPVYLHESRQHRGSCSRLREVPLRLGYTPRAEPYFAKPHPFY